MSQGSYDGRLVSDLVRESRRRGGSYETREARERVLRAFARWLRRMNVQIRKADRITNAHLRDYISARKLEGLTLGSLQNIASYVRAVALNVSFTNQELGIAGRNRDGVREPCPEKLYECARALISHPGVRAVIALQWALGLRASEALAAGPSLGRLKHEVSGGLRPYIIDGTKGGRPREVEIPDRAVAIRAIDEALAALESMRSKHLIPARTRRTALSIYHRECGRVGLSGIHSPHSLRYAFTWRLIRYFAQRGYDERTAYAAAALALGHGNGRARYIKRVYGRGMPPYATLRREHAKREIRLSGLSARYRWNAPTGIYLRPEIWNVDTFT